MPQNFSGDLSWLAQWVKNLIAGCEINEPLYLIVHDIGGPFGLSFATEYPEKVRGLIILNTPFSSSYRWHFLARLLRLPVLGEILQGLITKILTHELRGSKGLSEASALETATRYSKSARTMSLLLYRSWKSDTFLSWEDRLKSIFQSRPTLVLWGDKDPYISPIFAEKFSANTTEHFKDYGHWLQVEASQVVAQRIDEFVDGVRDDI